MCTWTSSTVAPAYASRPCSFTVVPATTSTFLPLPEVLHFDTGVVDSGTTTVPCHGAVLALMAT